MANSDLDPYSHLPDPLRKRLDGWLRTKDTQCLTSDEVRDEIVRALAGFRTDLDLEVLMDVASFLTLRAAFMPFEPGRTEMDLGRQVEKHLEEMFAVPPDSAEGWQYIRQLPAVVDAASAGLRRLAGTDVAPVPLGARHHEDAMSQEAMSAAHIRRELDRRREQWLATGNTQTLTSDEALQDAMNLFHSSAKQGYSEGLSAFIEFLRLRASFLEPSQASKEAKFIEAIIGLLRANGIEVVGAGAPVLGAEPSKNTKRRHWRTKRNCG